MLQSKMWVDKLLKIHRYWIRFWVFDVVTVSLKCKNCFERGGFGSLSCFGIKGFKYLSCFGIKCKRFKYFPPSKTTWTGEQIQICKIWSFAEIWSLESRKKEVIKHTNVDIEQKGVHHDYLPGVRLMTTRGEVFHFYVNCIEFYVNWMQMVETRSALMQDWIGSSPHG